MTLSHPIHLMNTFGLLDTPINIRRFENPVNIHERYSNDPEFVKKVLKRRAKFKAARKARKRNRL